VDLLLQSVELHWDWDDMLTGELRAKIDTVWNAFWSGGIANPIEVIEQITYLLFIRGLDDAHKLEERKATRLNKPMERRIFPGALWGRERRAAKRARDSGLGREDVAGHRRRVEHR
jgi:HsdM N-terminal domain